MTLRVAVIANSFDPNERHAGGFIHLTEVARRWRGVELTVMAPAGVRAIVEEQLAPTRFVPTPNLFALPRAMQWLLRGLCAIPAAYGLRKRCDVALVLAPFLPDTLPALAFGLRRSAVYLWHFIGNPFARPGNRLRNLLAWVNEGLGSALALRAGAAIVGTHLVAKQCGIADRANVFVTTNGVDHLTSASPPERRHGVVSVGRLHPAKGVEDVLHAWARLAPERRREGLRIVGEGSPAYVARLYELIARLEIGNSVELVGPVDDARKVALLQEARVFAFASREEGWCIALAEAMSNGLACVTYDLPVFREVFPCGRIEAPSGNVVMLADAIERVLADGPLCNGLARDAERLATGFTWQRAADVERAALDHVAAARR